ncbi:MAG: hypothetical protein WCZ98_06715 [Sideroxydans sp.]
MLSQQVTTLIDKELKKYPADQRQSAVMAALRFVQDEKGLITPEDMADVAAYLAPARLTLPHPGAAAIFEHAPPYRGLGMLTPV